MRRGIPVCSNDGWEGVCPSKELPEIMQGIHIGGEWQIVMRQMARDHDELQAAWMKQLRANEAAPLEGSQNPGRKGLVDEDGLAMVTIEHVGGYNPVVPQLLMHLYGGIIGVKEARGGEVSLRKPPNFLQSDEVIVNSLIRQHVSNLKQGLPPHIPRCKL